jgi:type IV secretory pathway protease TraF
MPATPKVEARRLTGIRRRERAMTAVEVTPADTPHVYDVEVVTDGQRTRHRVTVPTDPAGAGLPDVEPDRLVRESMAFLLEREPPSAILGEFQLPLIARYFPEYQQELQRRLD